MAGRDPFVLLDDARGRDGGGALLYRGPLKRFVARRPDEVAGAIAAASAAAEAGGHVAGYIAYEAGYALEPALAGHALPRTGGAGPLVWFARFPEPEAIAAADVPARLAREAAVPARIGPLDPALSPGAYAEAFARVQEAIRAGDIYQANLTFPLAGGFEGDPLALYAALRPAGAAGHGAVVFDGSHWLLSLSPELMVACDGHDVRCRPMKGTRPRSGEGETDAAAAGSLAASEKDRAEHLMIVDLMRNDLARIAAPGSVRVEDAFAIESYPTVYQMVTTVRADLAVGAGLSDIVAAVFPCGSITGAPKIAAMQVLADAERGPRGPYCGAIGRLGPGRTARLSVAIRTLRLTEIENGRGKAVLGVGGAVVADSTADGEWREALLKGSFVARSSSQCRAPGFDLLETMRFTPDGGIHHLEAHLMRMKESAQALGFLFDRHEARNRLHALCFLLEGASRIRLLAARGGAIAVDIADMPPAWPDPAPCIVLPLPVDPGDWRLRHKTTDRGFYDEGRRVARAHKAAEAVLIRDDGLLTEGCATSLFVRRGDRLVTPPATLDLLPGILRADLIARGEAVEGEVRLDDLEDGFFVGNALRGLMPARLAEA